MLYIFSLNGALAPRMAEQIAQSQDVHLSPGLVERASELRTAGHKIAVIANFSEVAWGTLRMYEAERLMLEIKRMVQANLYQFSPVDPSAQGKPGANGVWAIKVEPDSAVAPEPDPGMLLYVMRKLNSSPDETTLVSSSESSQQAASKAGCRFEWADVFLRR
jgi:histidinol phosphatase-like enzyme